MKLSEELQWRGFVNQMTYKDIAELDSAPITFYWGVDPSADSMTIGNLAAAMMVRHFIDHGHNAILLIGGATGLIGDPDGKSTERDLLTLDEIARNKSAITEQYKRVFDGQAFQIVDNYEWFKNMNYLSFLRDIGKHVPMSQMLDREFIKTRLGSEGSGISYAEFSYSLIQGYDFLHLFRNSDVTLQVCGADQWGNSIAGVDLIRRIDGGEANVYSVPLIVNKATGKKFGKSEEGAVWLDPAKTSVFKFYQFWLNVDDEGSIDYLKVYTLLDKKEIETIAKRHADSPQDRLAQRTLAQEVTDLVHGKDRRESVEKVTRVLFGSEMVKNLNDEELGQLAEEIPSVSVGNLVVDLLVESGLASSKGEARRLIDNGAISLDGKKISSDQTVTVPSLLRKGKNSFALVR